MTHGIAFLVQKLVPDKQCHHKTFAEWQIRTNSNHASLGPIWHYLLQSSQSPTDKVSIELQQTNPLMSVDWLTVSICFFFRLCFSQLYNLRQKKSPGTKFCSSSNKYRLSNDLCNNVSKRLASSRNKLRKAHTLEICCLRNAIFTP